MLIYRCAWCEGSEPALILVLRHFKEKHPTLEKSVLDASPTSRDGPLTFWTDQRGKLMFLSCPEGDNISCLRKEIKNLKI